MAAIPVAMDYTFPAGTSYRKQPLIVEGQVGMVLKGQRNANGHSRLVYHGPPLPPGRGIIELVGCTRTTLRDLEIITDTPGVDRAVLITNAVDPGNQGYSTTNVIENVRVMRGLDSVKQAFAVDSFAAGGQDANNDHHVFNRCYAQSFSQYGFSINGSQCHQLIFNGCIAADTMGRRPIGLYAEKGIYFSMRDCGFNGNSIDVLLGSAEVQAVFDGINSENSQRFLSYKFASGMPHINLSNLRWEGKPVAGRHVIEIEAFGPTSIRNAFISSQNGICPTMRFAGLQGSVDLSGVTVRQVGGTLPTTPIITAPSTWQSRQYGIFHHHVPVIGLPAIRRVVVNQPF